MSRGTSEAFNTAAEASVIYPAYFVDMTFDTGPLRLWTGYGDFTLNSKVYTGMGDIGAISPITEASDVVSNGVVLSLNGLPSSILSLVLLEAKQGVDVDIQLALFDAAGALIDADTGLFKGFMDIPSIEKSGDRTNISVTIEDSLVKLRRSNQRRYTDQDQKDLFPGDDFFEYLNGIQFKQIIF